MKRTPISIVAAQGIMMECEMLGLGRAVAWDCAMNHLRSIWERQHGLR